MGPLDLDLDPGPLTARRRMLVDREIELDAESRIVAKMIRDLVAYQTDLQERIREIPLLILEVDRDLADVEDVRRRMGYTNRRRSVRR